MLITLLACFKIYKLPKLIRYHIISFLPEYIYTHDHLIEHFKIRIDHRNIHLLGKNPNILAHIDKFSTHYFKYLCLAGCRKLALECEIFWLQSRYKYYPLICNAEQFLEIIKQVVEDTDYHDLLEKLAKGALKFEKYDLYKIIIDNTGFSLDDQFLLKYGNIELVRNHKKMFPDSVLKNKFPEVLQFFQHTYPNLPWDFWLNPEKHDINKYTYGEILTCFLHAAHVGNAEICRKILNSGTIFIHDYDSLPMHDVEILKIYYQFKIKFDVNWAYSALKNYDHESIKFIEEVYEGNYINPIFYQITGYKYY